MRVVHVITGLGRGGAEAMLVRLLAALKRSDVESHVITLLPHGALWPDVEAEAASVTTLGLGSALPNPFALVRLGRQIRRLNPDIVHGWMYHAALAALLAAPSRPHITAIR